VIYTAYLLIAWNRLHHLYDSPTEVFQAPFDSTIEQLFDNQHTGQQVVIGTPDDIGQLLTPHAFQMLRHPTGPLAAALRIADGTCTDWTQRALIRLYMATADEQAANANSYRCQAALHSHGIGAPVVSVGDVDHLDSNRLGTAAVVRWFLQLSSPSAISASCRACRCRGVQVASHHLDVVAGLTQGTTEQFRRSRRRGGSVP